METAMYTLTVGLEHLMHGAEFDAIGNLSFWKDGPSTFIVSSFQPFSVYWTQTRDDQDPVRTKRTRMDAIQSPYEIPHPSLHSEIRFTCEHLNQGATMNGTAIIAETKDAVYVRIPPAFQVKAGDGKCSCPHCEQSGSVAMWDTLVVPKVPKSHGDFAHTVHMPDPEAFKAQLAKVATCQHEYNRSGTACRNCGTRLPMETL